MKNTVKKMPEGRQLLRALLTDKMSFNGKIIKFGDAPSLLPHSLFYGGCAWGGAMIRLGITGNPLIYAAEAHAQRVIESALELGISLNEMNFTRDDIVKAMYDAAEANDFALHYMRPFIMRNGISYGIAVPPSDEVAYGAIALPFKAYYSGPVRVLINTINDRPSNPNAFAQSKASGSGMYPVSAKAKELAKKHKANDSLFTYYRLFEKERLIAEGASNNYAFVKADGTIVVPKPRGTFLYGTTIQTMVYLAREVGIKVEIRDIELTELLNGEFVGAITSGNAAGLTIVKEFVTLDNTVISMRVDLEVISMLKGIFDEFIITPGSGEKVPFFYDNGKTTDVI